MDENSKKLKEVWAQKEIPVILRRNGNGQSHRLRLPYAGDNRAWIQNGRRKSPDWIAESRYWEIPKAWFNDLVNRALERYGRVYIIQPYREHEKCASACQNAVGHECQCSCMGKYHGAGNDGSWFEVSDTFSVRSTNPKLACRLMQKN
jgi:hypothetical protein